MKTVITICNTVQVGVENYEDVKYSKVFDDDSTILDIKKWIQSETANNLSIEQIGITGTSISDLKE